MVCFEKDSAQAGIATNTRAYENTNGLLEAWIDIKDPITNAWKFKETAPSTFFPQIWDVDRVLEELASGILDAKRSGKFGIGSQGVLIEGTTNSGIRIQGYLENINSTVIKTLYPLK